MDAMNHPASPEELKSAQLYIDSLIPVVEVRDFIALGVEDAIAFVDRGKSGHTFFSTDLEWALERLPDENSAQFACRVFLWHEQGHAAWYKFRGEQKGDSPETFKGANSKKSDGVQPRGEAGDVLEERLLGGTAELLCTTLEPYRELEIHVVYTPASGEHAGRECRLAETFVEEFLERPRCPLPSEYELFPPKTHFFDLACASGHLPMENSVAGRRAVETPRTPQKSGRFGARAPGACGMRCGIGRMGRSGARCPDADSLRSTASEKAGQGGLTVA